MVRPRTTTGKSRTDRTILLANPKSPTRPKPRAAATVLKTAGEPKDAQERRALSSTEVMAYLQIGRARLQKHVDRSELPVAYSRTFVKWGRTLAAASYHPADVAALAAAHYPERAACPIPLSRGARALVRRDAKRTEKAAITAEERRRGEWAGRFLRAIPVSWLAEEHAYPGQGPKARAPGSGRIAVIGVLAHARREGFRVLIRLDLDRVGAHLAGEGPLPAPAQAWKRVRAWATEVARAWLEDRARAIAALAGWPDGVREAVLTRLEVQRSIRADLPMPFDSPLDRLKHPWGSAAHHLAKMVDADPALRDRVRAWLGCAEPAAWFSHARALGRRWTVWLGPTNSGKTHHALETLKAAGSGLYLAPLRLMALETYDRLNAAGIACALRTGEERREPWSGQSPTHLAATVEAGLDERAWDVAVVDEAQMLKDGERGWAWTHALLGVAARHLCVCAAPEAETALTALAGQLGEPLSFHRVERATPLRALPHPVRLDAVRPGDALIAFSRQRALGYRAWLRQRGHSVACIYGDLGPEVRRHEAERFRTGEAAVLVATDAIGMGLNLPIRRVIMTETEKYDGRARRTLTPGEWRQIGGRAGRRGFHECGEVGVLKGLSAKEAQKNLGLPVSPLSATPLFIQPTWAVVERVAEVFGLTRLSYVLEQTASLLEGQSLWSARWLRQQAQTPWVQALAAVGMDIRLQFDYMRCPVRLTQVGTVRHWAKTHQAGQPIAAPVVGGNGAPSTLAGLETLERVGHDLGTYRWLALAFPKVYPQGAEASERLAGVQERIARALAEQGLHRLCTGCGRSLAVTRAFPLCDRCHWARRSTGARSDDDDGCDF